MTNTKKKVHKAVLTIDVYVTVDENENWCFDEIDEMIGYALEAGSKATEGEVHFDFASCQIEGY
jgi:hypothetical protein